MAPKLSVGPHDYKAGAGFMYKIQKKISKKTGKPVKVVKVRQVYKLQPKKAKYHRALKGGLHARVIVLSKRRVNGKVVYKLLHTTKAKTLGWKRVTKRTSKKLSQMIKTKKSKR